MSSCIRLLANDTWCGRRTGGPVVLKYGVFCRASCLSATCLSRVYRTNSCVIEVIRKALPAMTAQANGSIIHHDEGESESVIGEAVVAVVTPFTPDGKVDEQALEAYLQHLHTNGVKHIVVNGTTGEFWAMTLDERQRVAAAARRHFPGKVIVNVSACSLGDVHTLLEHCMSGIEGGRPVADAALLLPPFYYERAPADGVRAFIEAALAHAKLPVVLYNYPRHCGNTVGAEAFRELRTHYPVLQGVKNSEMPLAECAAYRDGGAAVLIGTEDLVAALDQGFHGFITGGTWSAFPQVMADVHSAYRSGEVERARTLQHERLDPWSALLGALTCEPIPASKAALSAIIPGFCPVVRAPLLSATDADMQAIRTFLKQHACA